MNVYNMFGILALLIMNHCNLVYMEYKYYILQLIFISIHFKTIGIAGRQDVLEVKSSSLKSFKSFESFAFRSTAKKRCFASSFVRSPQTHRSLTENLPPTSPKYNTNMSTVASALSVAGQRTSGAPVRTQNGKFGRIFIPPQRLQCGGRCVCVHNRKRCV